MRRSRRQNRAALFRRRAAAGAIVVSLAVFGCAPRTSDTGFRGTWSRESGAQVSIWQEGEAWRFCWSSEARDSAAPSYRCDPREGRTYMQQRGEATYRYDVRMALEDPRTATLEIVGEPIDETLTPIRWTDRLELDAAGTTLLSWRTSLNGRRFDAPQGPLRLRKVADRLRH